MTTSEEALANHLTSFPENGRFVPKAYQKGFEAGYEAHKSPTMNTEEARRKEELQKDALWQEADKEALSVWPELPPEEYFSEKRKRLIAIRNEYRAGYISKGEKEALRASQDAEMIARLKAENERLREALKEAQEGLDWLLPYVEFNALAESKYGKHKSAFERDVFHAYANPTELISTALSSPLVATDEVANNTNS